MKIDSISKKINVDLPDFLKKGKYYIFLHIPNNWDGSEKETFTLDNLRDYGHSTWWHESEIGSFVPSKGTHEMTMTYRKGIANKIKELKKGIKNPKLHLWKDSRGNSGSYKPVWEETLGKLELPMHFCEFEIV